MVGGGIANPDDALTISKRALALGFSSTIGIIHDGAGQLKPLGDRERAVWDEVRRLTRRSYSRFNGFQEAIANGQPNDWRCRAGSRYLYVDENGIVSYCSQQRGYPGIPIADYTTEIVKREFLTEKVLRPQLHDLAVSTRSATSTTGALRSTPPSPRRRRPRRSGPRANPISPSSRASRSPMISRHIGL